MPTEIVKINNIAEAKMRKDGFSEKMMHHYYSYILEEDSTDFPEGFADWSHEHGFLASHAMTLGINELNYRDYISEYEYYRCFPHNSWLKIWINDKLSLKYLLQETQYEKYMPEYYFYYVPSVGLRSLCDASHTKCDVDELIRVLIEKRELACKPNNGAESAGFYHIQYCSEQGTFLMNKEKVKESDVRSFVLNSPNYLYTEYIRPGYGFENIYPDIHTLRVVVINEHGDSPQIVGGYLRFPVDNQRGGNYSRQLKDDDYMFYTMVNMSNGQVLNPMAIYKNKVEHVNIHPDTGYVFDNRLFIPNWNEIVEMVKGISQYLFGIELMGFDIGITDKGAKIMEINSLPGSMGCQFSRPVYDDSEFVKYIRNKNRIINEMNEEEKARRFFLK